MSDKKQMDIVLSIVREHQPIRTEQVKIKAMSAGCSCADRYLRWLQRDQLIISEKHPHNRTKTWKAVAGPQVSIDTDNSGQLILKTPERAYA